MISIPGVGIPNNFQDPAIARSSPVGFGIVAIVTSAAFDVDSPGPPALASGESFLEPLLHAMLAPGMLGHTPVLGSLYILDDTLDAERCCAWVNQRDDRALGATSLPNGSGLLVRALGDAPSAVHTKLRGLWSRFEECAGLEAE